MSHSPDRPPPLLGLSQRLPPTNLQAEQALLGALLANNKAFDRVSAFLQAHHFADPVHARVYAAIAARIEAGRVADTVALKGDFENSGVLDDVGGTGYLAQLLSAMVGIINAGEYGRAIRDAWHRRALIEIGETLVNEAFASGADGRDAASVHEAAEAALFALGEKGDDGEAWSPAHEAMDAAIRAAELNRDRPGGLVGISTGLRDVDDLTGGLQRGDYWILAGRPGMGKTAFALSITVGAIMAAPVEKPVRALFVTKEMPRLKIGAALVAGTAKVPRHAAQRGKVQSRDDVGRFVWFKADPWMFDRMLAAQKAMAQRTLILDECRAGTISAIRAAARRQIRRGGLDLLVVDYLQLLSVPGLERSDNQVLKVSELSRQTKALAVDLNVPVIMLSQLNRGVEARDDKRPRMSDLRDSGSLEQDADGIMFLFREHYYLRTRQPLRSAFKTEEAYASAVYAWAEQERCAKGFADLIIEKQRTDRVGTVKLRFDEETTWFSDVGEDDATS